MVEVIQPFRAASTVGLGAAAPGVAASAGAAIASRAAVVAPAAMKVRRDTVGLDMTPPAT
jgi:hypothetical protein